MDYFLVVYLFIIFFQKNSQGQYIDNNLCHGRCYCSELDSVVDCSPQDKVGGLPTNLPPGIKKLVIQGGVFPAPGHLARKNLTGLSHLISLRVINSQLRSIESRAFLGMTNLRHLDLSLNQFHMLEPYTFYGLKLTHLYLQEQNLNQIHLTSFMYAKKESRGLQLADEVFHGLSAGQINLLRNGISDINFDLFSEVSGLQKLIFSSNNIQTLDSKFSEYFDKPDRLIDLTDNPLVCSCNLAWLANRVKEWVTNLPSLNITCIVDKYIKKPINKFGREVIESPKKVELQKLSSEHLCLSSRIRSIGVELTPTGSTATLSCTAVSTNSLTYKFPASTEFISGNLKEEQSVVKLRQPSVAWKYVEAGQLRQVSWMPSEPRLDSKENKVSNDKSTTTVQLNVSLLNADRQFTCITWDDRKKDQEVLVTVRLPRNPTVKFKQNETSETLSTTINKNGQNAYDALGENKKGKLKHKLIENDAKMKTTEITPSYSTFVNRKQYSLLQMFLAIGGTFFCTLILLLALSKCRTWYQNQPYRFPPPTNIIDGETKNVHVISRTNCCTVDGEMSKPVNMTNNGSVKNNTNCLNNNVIPVKHELTSSPMSPVFPAYNPYLGQNSISIYPSFMPTAPMVTSPGYQHIIPNNMSLSTDAPLLQTKPNQSALLVPNLQNVPQQMGFWPPPPMSAYSPANSHEYDIPRGMDASQITSNQSINNSLHNGDFLGFGPTYRESTGN